MAHAEDEDEELSFLNFVDDSIVTRPNPPLVRTSNETSCSRGLRILGEQLEGRLDSSTNI